LVAHIGIKWPAKAFKETLVIKVYKEHRAHLVDRVIKVHKVFKALLVVKVYKVFKDLALYGKVYGVV
jgi:hypothetical protein